MRGIALRLAIQNQSPQPHAMQMKLTPGLGEYHIAHREDVWDGRVSFQIRIKVIFFRWMMCVAILAISNMSTFAEEA